MTTHAPLAPAQAPAPRKGNPWRPTFRGVGLVTKIELLRRRPTTRGFVAYGLLLLGIIGLGVLASAMAPNGKDAGPMELVLVLVLGAGVLIAPSLSATSINGDSGEGVLAPLQMTHLTAGDLAFGKLLASWLVSVAVLITTVPFLLYAFSRSGWHWDELLTVMGVILLVVLTSTAVGLAWSSIAARAVASVSLAHLTTGFLVLGSLVLFAVTTPLVSTTRIDTYRYIDWEAMSSDEQTALDNAYMTGDFSGIDFASLPCAEETQETYITHTERTAWLLLINPGVVIAEVSPIVDPMTWEVDGRAAPGFFATIHQAVSSARMGADLEPQVYDSCSSPYGDDQWMENQQENANFPRSPWLGLGVQVLLLLGSMVIVVRRLRVPYKKLRAGTRVA